MGKRKTPDFLTARHFTLYWKIDPVKRNDLNAHYDTLYASSKFLKNVQFGDTLWIVNVHVGRLYLLGRLRVMMVTSDSELAQSIVDSDKEWWEAETYAIADKRDVEPLREIDITEQHDQVTFGGGEGLRPPPIDALQVRVMREITPETAELFNRLWHTQQHTETLDGFLEDEDRRVYKEGRKITRTLNQRGRNRQLVEEAKRHHKQENGHLTCEVCGFDFEAFYGVNYIEAHHETPLSSLNEETENTIDDLRLLCANCHRAIHSQKTPIPVDVLRQRLKEKGKI